MNFNGVVDVGYLMAACPEEFVKKCDLFFCFVLEIPSIFSTIFNILDPAQVMIMMAKMMMILMFKKFEYENWQHDNSFKIVG